MSDLVALRLYIVDFDPPKDSPEITDVLKEVFAGSEPPACTWIGVACLANEGFLIEIEATAVVEGESESSR